MWVGFHFHVYPNACKTSDFKDFPLTHVITSFSFFLIEVWLIYNVVLVSSVQQRDSIIHIYSFPDSFPYG